ncbi:hypothetical protein HOY82DRAFT_609926 [Tuber indicum]|nr:hypothetical protein HOY82DRAFT_609926 [Tuber indicum]
MGQFTNVKTQFAMLNIIRCGQRIDAHSVIGTPGMANNMLDLQGLGERFLRVKQLEPAFYELWKLDAHEGQISSSYRSIPSITQIALSSANLLD